MDLNGMGLLGAIIVGGIAGWLAEQFMKSNMGILHEYHSGHRRRGAPELHPEPARCLHRKRES